MPKLFEAGCAVACGGVVEDEEDSSSRLEGSGMKLGRRLGDGKWMEKTSKKNMKRKHVV